MKKYDMIITSELVNIANAEPVHIITNGIDIIIIIEPIYGTICN
jgi:hypothetical protein